MEYIKHFISSYESALATQSWEQVSPLIHTDCVATFSEGTHIGKNLVESAFRKTFNLIKDETYKINNILWAIKSESLAVIIYNFNWSGIINGKLASGTCRGTSTVININGQWQLIAEHLGPNA
ncbi:nuclear transport factor 2 family protein [Porticoccaceae bacterium]|nr:nuclear transport factor 2 family protein [Porticoccaceae bacterium]